MLPEKPAEVQDNLLRLEDEIGSAEAAWIWKFQMSLRRKVQKSQLVTDTSWSAETFAVSAAFAKKLRNQAKHDSEEEWKQNKNNLEVTKPEGFTM